MTNIQYFFMIAGIAAVVGFVLWAICRIIISIIERPLERELLKEFEALLKKITDDQEDDGDA